MPRLKPLRKQRSRPRPTAQGPCYRPSMAKAGADIDLNDDVFGVDARADILHRVVAWQLESSGPAPPASSDVARTGKKFGHQKGGGTARHGDRKAPIFIGGGEAHDLRARTFGHSLNKKIRALGLKMALASTRQGQLVVIDTRSSSRKCRPGAGRQARQARPRSPCALHRRRCGP